MITWIKTPILCIWVAGPTHGAKFVKVVKVRKKHRSKRENPKGLADEALDYIGKLYQFEKEARRQELETAQIYQLRQEKAKPV